MALKESCYFRVKKYRHLYNYLYKIMYKWSNIHFFLLSLHLKFVL